ncbi:MAG: SUMF1/EgtB/PvdO family nonheme iron enzyme [Spirochaetes bacterium]|nr:SUMF1/EgtB/PvdO family nonheme iron enzyme [Spirochaetota bacterium]
MFAGLIFWSCSDDEGGTEPSNDSPSCSITSPANDATFTIGNNITVNVDADDTDGTISEVRFYFDGNEIGLDTTFPYSYTISTTSYTEGIHTIKATSKDNDDAETSSQINITLSTGIAPPTAPTLISPTNGSLVQNLTPTFDWSDATGATSYKILVDNNSDFSSPVINESPTTSSYTPTSNITAGTYFWKVLATNPAGTSAYTNAWSVTITSSFVYVQGGTFEMGDHFSEGYIDELPLHSVTVSDFYMGATEVTQAEWSAYMPAEDWSLYGTGDTYPAYYISFYEIIKYCNLRSIAEGLTPCYTINSSTDPADWGTVPISSNATWNASVCNWAANGYRLPSEAEWEYASRGGIHNADNYRYSGSNTDDDVAWYYANSGSTSHPVGLKVANQIGLYDMSGNLWEWCNDWYGSYTSDAQINPYGPTTGTYRVKRGGSWDQNATSCRVADRNAGFPSDSDYYIGFRLAKTP